MRWRLLCFLTPLLALAVPLYARSLHFDIPVLRWEMLPVAGALLAATLAFGFLFMWAGPRLLAALLAGLLLLSFDLQFGAWDLAEDHAESVANGGWANLLQLALLVFVAALLLLLAWVLRRQALVIASAYFGVVLASTIATQVIHQGSQVAAEPATEAEPQRALAAVGGEAPDLVLHLMFDALTAPAALPTEIPGGRELKQQMRAFQDRFGFRLYDRVYSRYSITYHSMSSMLNYLDAADGSVLEKIDADSYRLTRNQFFEDLRRQGYRIEVLQYEILDFCAPSGIANCRTQPLYNPLDPQVAAAMEPGHRTLNAALKLIGHDSVLHRAIVKARRTLDERIIIFPQYSTQSALSLLDRIPRMVVEAPPRSAIFAHIMMPHYPFLWDSTCQRVDLPAYRQGVEGYGRNGAAFAPGYVNDAESRADRYQSYFAQTACLFRKLSGILADPAVAERLKNALVIIHGDHGSRIAMVDHQHDHVALLSDRDLVDLHATFFAIRGARFVPGVDSEFMSLQSLFPRLLAGRRLVAGSDSSEHSIQLLRRPSDATLMETPNGQRRMPADWGG